MKITDFGLSFLKDFCSLLKTPYKNKDQYTSPEQLKLKGLTSKKITQADDVYSYGVILWQIFHKEVPFEGMSFEQIKEVILVQNSRPKIDP